MSLTFACRDPDVDGGATRSGRCPVGSPAGAGTPPGDAPSCLRLDRPVVPRQSAHALQPLGRRGATRAGHRRVPRCGLRLPGADRPLRGSVGLDGHGHRGRPRRVVHDAPGRRAEFCRPGRRGRVLGRRHRTSGGFPGSGTGRAPRCPDSPGGPGRRLQRPAAPGLTNLLDFDRLPVQDLHAVETYNFNAAHSWPDQAEGRYVVDALLARDHRLHVAVGDDAHWLHRWDRFGAWVQVRAEHLDPEALLRALHAGAYYSTQGPRIDDVRVEGDRVHVTCSRARAIALTGIHGWRSDVAEGDPTLEGAVLDIGKLKSPYWRLTVTAQDGTRAW